MAQYNGYRIVPHITYDMFRNATYGNGYNVDGFAGNQCWDYCALLWHQYNLPLVTKTGGGGAKDCWLVSKNTNARLPFIAVNGVTNIKRGDIIVTNANPWSSVGHIAIADENYRKSGDKNRIWCVGQAPANFGINGTVQRHEVNLAYFLGIFRNTMWLASPEPTPTPTPSGWYNRDRYNFVLFNRRKRQEKWTRKPLNRKSKS